MTDLTDNTTTDTHIVTDLLTNMQRLDERITRLATGKHNVLHPAPGLVPPGGEWLVRMFERLLGSLNDRMDELELEAMRGDEARKIAKQMMGGE